MVDVEDVGIAEVFIYLFQSALCALLYMFAQQMCQYHDHSNIVTGVSNMHSVGLLAQQPIAMGKITSLELHVVWEWIIHGPFDSTVVDNVHFSLTW